MRINLADLQELPAFTSFSLGDAGIKSLSQNAKMGLLKHQS